MHSHISLITSHYSIILVVTCYVHGDCIVVIHRLKVYHLQSTRGDVAILVSTEKEEDSFTQLVELKNNEFG